MQLVLIGRYIVICAEITAALFLSSDLDYVLFIFFVSISTEGANYLVHEELCFAVVPKESRCQVGVKSLKLVMRKVKTRLTWNYLSKKHCKVRCWDWNFDFLLAEKQWLRELTFTEFSPTCSRPAFTCSKNLFLETLGYFQESLLKLKCPV